ncbi:hypothetical protein B0H16DRAFT_2914 [Mycena metata]|uniref:F-box domain-containing protein n=1 Tax=Mycena metata TaxID=1033252 RepID=A0AAD7KKK0_9AGAR|nr:hypothetical protein B0H16DRAFT_2914 [Mycena metata]
MSEALPAEIWTQIHCLACTDDGFNGRALSRVSKDWRTISAPFKFQSIALVGALPILRFLCILDSIPESVRNIQCLFIGCPNLRLTTSRLDLARERARGLDFSDKLFPELGITPYTHTLQIHPDAIAQTVVRILQRTASTLRTLHTHLVFLGRPGPLYSISLRHVRTLVLHGPFASPSPSLSPIFPNLRRLRLASSKTTTKGAVLLTTIAAAAPRLSHLYLSHTACTRKDLERALEHSNLRNLTRLVVEVGAFRRSHSPPNNPATESLEHAGLLRLAQTDARVRIVAEKRWWVDVQAALIEWEEADELQWDEREELE